MTNYKKKHRMDSITETNVETPVKRPRGRPSKYAPEERKDKYKEASKLWHRESYDKQFECVKNYQDRSRFALKILNDLWSENLIDIKSDKYKIIVQNLVEHKKITA